ncbi:MAG: Ycf66 family protein [Timaviella obliquedivisa GSE-PSE-MK23-08B]|jgi:hypothetical protein|nr:Ycf66 family protein [Timaviella obliquedivisa GSE-PSE-MK23-08B]
MTYLLALIVGLGSLGLYLAAFLFEEVHRKSDLIWSGVGMFYALVLWVCAGRITGGVLLGQMAAVSLLGWLGWQVLEMRWEQIPLPQRAALPHSPALLLGVLRDRARQLQINLQQSSWRSSSLNQVTQFAEKSVRLMIALFDWSAALIGTTVKSWDVKSWEQPVPPSEPTPPESPESVESPPKTVQESSPFNNQNPL